MGLLDVRCGRKLASAGGGAPERSMGHEREEALGERAQHLLRILIESYIRDGQPVGSRALSRESGLQLSCATVRNVMAGREQRGSVGWPQPAAGRVHAD